MDKINVWIYSYSEVNCCVLAYAGERNGDIQYFGTGGSSCGGRFAAGVLLRRLCTDLTGRPAGVAAQGHRWAIYLVWYGVVASRDEAGLRRPQEGHVALMPFLSEQYVAFANTTVLLGAYYLVFRWQSISTDGHLPPWNKM